MMEQSEHFKRQTAIHLIRSGKSPVEVAQELGRSISWVYKWKQRFFAQEDWEALHSRSRAPRHRPGKLAETVCQAIRQARSELEAETHEPGKLSYVGGYAVQGRLRKKKVEPLPSISSIERILRESGMTRPRRRQTTPVVDYPHLRPTEPHQLEQVDIVPRYLPGGGCVSCFNAIDVVSRYPTGYQFLSKRSEDAVEFLLLAWRELGIPRYTQVDNESCFSGGFSHPGVLGKVLRLALWVGTELVFSPFYHPESNGTVERFHQDYATNVWDKIELPDVQAVRYHSPAFFEAYRHSPHHSALKGYSPAELHFAVSPRNLPASFSVPKQLPLTEGQVHFIRQVDEDKTVSILNMRWYVSLAQPAQGVWATLTFALHGAILRIYDAAPDATKRTCLAEHPFPLKQVVQPPSEFRRPLNTQHQSWSVLISELFGYFVPRKAVQWISTML